VDWRLTNTLIKVGRYQLNLQQLYANGHKQFSVEITWFRSSLFTTHRHCTN